MLMRMEPFACTRATKIWLAILSLLVVHLLGLVCPREVPTTLATISQSPPVFVYQSNNGGRRSYELSSYS